MKWTVVVLAALLALAGCAGPNAPTAASPSTSQEARPDRAAADQAAKDNAFLFAVRSDMQMAPTKDGDAGLVKDAHTICKGFDDGLIWVQMVTTVSESTKGILTARQVGELIGASVLVYCPDHAGVLPNN